MKTQADYKPNLAFGLLLKGMPKRGKTILALRFPNPYIADADNNLSGAMRYYRQTEPTKEIRYDTINIDDNGVPVEKEKRWTRLVECCKAAAKDPWVKTIIADSVMSISAMLIDHILAEKAEANKSNNRMSERDKNQMTISDWIPFRMLLTRFVTTFRSVNKFFIMTSHEQWEKDELTGDMYIRPALPSNLRDNFGGYFSDEWLLDMENGLRVIKTVGDTRRSLGASLDLPDKPFVFEWTKFNERLNQFNNVVKGKVS